MTFDSVGEGYPTPEEAARGDIPRQFAIVVGVQTKGDEATVWLLTNDRPPFEEYEVTCRHERDRWFSEGGAGGFNLGTPPAIRARARELGG